MPLHLSIKRTAAAVTVAAIGLALLVLPVNAGSSETETKVTQKEVCVTQYGGSTECKTEEITEEVKRDEVTHDTVDAGLEDLNFGQIAAITGLAGFALMGISKVTRNFDIL